MKSELPRKLPRFFIINPIRDRRLECRFESSEPIDIREEESGRVLSALAFDIGQNGLRIESATTIPIGTAIQVAFRNNADNIRCFGNVVWTAKKEDGPGFQCGMAVESWHGIVRGPESWKMYKGFKLKRDRRRKPR